VDSEVRPADELSLPLDVEARQGWARGRCAERRCDAANGGAKAAMGGGECAEVQVTKKMGLDGSETQAKREKGLKDDSIFWRCTSEAAEGKDWRGTP